VPIDSAVVPYAASISHLNLPLTLSVRWSALPLFSRPSYIPHQLNKTTVLNVQRVARVEKISWFGIYTVTSIVEAPSNWKRARLNYKLFAMAITGSNTAPITLDNAKLLEGSKSLIVL